MDTNHRSLGILLVISLMFASLAYAVDPEGAQIASSQDLGRFPTPSADDIDLTAGNITYVDLVSNMTTLRWTGLYGNATGGIKLGDSDGDVMYSWTGIGNLIYMCEVVPTWSTLADADLTAVAAAYGFIGGAAADNYTNTFSNTPENIGSNIFSLSSDFAVTLSSAATTWKTYSLTDGANIVFTGKVSTAGTSYNGETADYQLIVPEDGTNGDEDPTNWLLFLELV